MFFDITLGSDTRNWVCLYDSHRSISDKGDDELLTLLWFGFDCWINWERLGEFWWGFWARGGVFQGLDVNGFRTLTLKNHRNLLQDFWLFGYWISSINMDIICIFGNKLHPGILTRYLCHSCANNMPVKNKRMLWTAFSDTWLKKPQIDFPSFEPMTTMLIVHYSVTETTRPLSHQDISAPISIYLLYN